MKKIFTVLLLFIFVLTSCVETKYVIAYDDTYLTTEDYSRPVVVSSAPIYIFSPNLFTPYTYVYRPYFGFTYNISFWYYTNNWYWYNPYYHPFYMPYRNPYWYYGYYDHNHHHHPYHHGNHPLWVHNNNGCGGGNVHGNPTHHSTTLGHRSNVGPSVGNYSRINNSNVNQSSKTTTGRQPITIERQTVKQPQTTVQRPSNTVHNNAVKRPSSSIRTVPQQSQRQVNQQSRQPTNNTYRANRPAYRPPSGANSRINSPSTIRPTHQQVQTRARATSPTQRNSYPPRVTRR